jgi:hypothetical protein
MAKGKWRRKTKAIKTTITGTQQLSINSTSEKGDILLARIKKLIDSEFEKNISPEATKENQGTHNQRNLFPVFFLSLFAVVSAKLKGSSELLKSSINSEEALEPSEKLLFIVGLFYSAKEREIALGDVEERFKKESKKFGRRKAHALIVRDFLVDIYPITKTALVKLFKWVTFYAILKRIIS